MANSLTFPKEPSVFFSPMWPYSKRLLPMNVSDNLKQRSCFMSKSSLSISSRSGSLALRMLFNLSTVGTDSGLFFYLSLALELVTDSPGCFSLTWK